MLSYPAHLYIHEPRSMSCYCTHCCIQITPLYRGKRHRPPPLMSPPLLNPATPISDVFARLVAALGDLNVTDHWQSITKGVVGLAAMINVFPYGLLLASSGLGVWICTRNCVCVCGRESAWSVHCTFVFCLGFHCVWHPPCTPGECLIEFACRICCDAWQHT